MRLIEDIYKSGVNTGRIAKNSPVGKATLNYLNAIKDAATGGFDDYAATISTNTIKDLTPEEKAKLRAKNRADLIRASKDVGLQESKYINQQNIKLDAGATEDETVDMVLLLAGLGGPTKVAAKEGARVIARQYQNIVKSKGTKAADNWIRGQAANLRNKFVKQNPKAAEQIAKNKQNFESKLQKALDDQMATPSQIDEVLGAGGSDAVMRGNAMQEISNMNLDIAEELAAKAVKNPSNLTANEEASLLQSVRENAESLSKLAEEAGVTNKKDLPKFIKFVKDMGSILENSPINIRNNAKLAKGLDVASNLYNIGMSGLSIYDLWNEFSNYEGTDFVPTVFANLGRLGGSFGPKNLAFKILFSTLGYGAGDKLSRYGLRKLGFKSILNDTQKAEVRQGLRQPGMSEQLKNYGEYFTGNSGRRYHVVDDKVYAFDTGNMIPVSMFLDDISKKVAQDTQVVNDKIKAVNQQINEVEKAQSVGYEFAPETLSTLYSQKQELQNQLNKLEKSSSDFSITDEYNDESNIIEQVYKKELEPEVASNTINNYQQSQQVSQNLQDIYSLLENQYKANIENYFTPENLANDYFMHMREAARGRAANLTPEQFTNIRKAEALYQVIPQIRNQAINEYNTLYQLAQRDTDLGIKDKNLQEEIRNNYITNIVNQYKAQETARHNLQQEAIGYGNLQVNQVNAKTKIGQLDIAKQNAETNKQRAETYNQYVNQRGELIPYQQLEMMGSGLAGASQIGMSAEQFAGSNPEVAKQVFPGAYNQPQGQPQQPQQQQQQQQSGNQLRQNKQMIKNFIGNQ